MSYYDEEIIIAGPDTKSLSAVKVNRMASGTSGSRHNTEKEVIGAGSAAANKRNSARRVQNMLHSTHSTDDDGLLQEIIDHDDDDDDSEEEDSELQQIPMSNTQKNRRSASQRPTSSRFANLTNSKIMENDSDHSSTESENAELAATITADGISASGAAAALGFIPQKSRIASAQKTRSINSAKSMTKSMAKDEVSTPPSNITPEKWEQLNVDDEIKELFPYILKYTPQNIEIPYRLQPFIPEFVPAVGDVDAFLKVTTPASTQAHRQREIDEHVRKLGLYFLDEPGEQSQPSLLNMKLRSVLTGSGVNPRLVSASLIPTAKSAKDIDKWIAEVEQVHITQSIQQPELRKDIDSLLLNWPREYATAFSISDMQDNLQTDITNTIRILSQRFKVEGPLETQADYILNVQTLFALYLAANQAWE